MALETVGPVKADLYGQTGSRIINFLVLISGRRSAYSGNINNRHRHVLYYKRCWLLRMVLAFVLISGLSAHTK